MTGFKKGIYTALAGGFLALVITTIASPQGAVSFVQLVLGGSVVSTGNPLPITGSVTTNAGTQAVGITPTDRTITSTSGASQQVMAANATRHSINIVNNGPGSCGVNPTGGTASIGAAGTLTLSSLGSYSPRIPTLSALTVICPASQQLYADEN